MVESNKAAIFENIITTISSFNFNTTTQGIVKFQLIPFILFHSGNSWILHLITLQLYEFYETDFITI